MNPRSRSFLALIVVGCAGLTGACSPGAVTDLFGIRTSPSTSSSTSGGGGGGSTSSGTGGPSPLSLEVGTCFDAADDDGTTVLVVDCAEEHEEEVYATEELPTGSFPGDESVWQIADDLCVSAFDDFVGKSYEDSVVDYYPYTPYLEDWQAGLHTVVCSAYDLKRWPTTGTLKGSGR